MADAGAIFHSVEGWSEGDLGRVRTLSGLFPYVFLPYMSLLLPADLQSDLSQASQQPSQLVCSCSSTGVKHCIVHSLTQCTIHLRAITPSPSLFSTRGRSSSTVTGLALAEPGPAFSSSRLCRRLQLPPLLCPVPHLRHLVPSLVSSSLSSLQAIMAPSTRTLFYNPTAAQREASLDTVFRHYVNKKHGLNLRDYWELHRWSCDNMNDFWVSFRCRREQRDGAAEQAIRGAADGESWH